MAVHVTIHVTQHVEHVTKHVELHVEIHVVALLLQMCVPYGGNPAVFADSF